MKGVVFTEFLELVGATYSEDTVDDIIEDCEFPHGGAFTSVGTYDYAELVALATALSKRTGTQLADLLQVFGKHMFARFRDNYPKFFSNATDTFSFLETVENHIHVEVLKLYPDAELPTFSYSSPAQDHMVLTYRSTRPFADLAHGLILGCAAHFGETVELDREDLPGGAQFSLRKVTSP